MSFKKNIKASMALGLLLSSLLLSSFNVHAQTSMIKSVANWSLWETTTPQQTLCFMQGSDIIYGDSGPTTNTYLRVLKAKNSPDSPAEIMLLLASNPSSSTGLVANLNGAAQLSFSDTSGSKKTFWGVPTSLANFNQQLRSSKNNVKVKGVGGRRNNEALINTTGYNEILAEMQNRCNSGVSIITPEFEQEFFAQIPSAIDPTRIDANKTAGLRDAYLTAYKTFGAISATKSLLAQLLAKYQTLIDELKINRAQAEQLQNVEIPQAQAALSLALAAQSEALVELAKIKEMIPELTAKIKKSQKILDDAKALVIPLQPEHDRITMALSIAQSSLTESQSRLNYIEMRLKEGPQQLQALRSESDSIERFLPQRRSDLDRAQSIYREAQHRRSQYNISRERDYRLSNNREYNRLHNDRNHMQHNLRQAERDTQRLRNERDHVARELHECRAQLVAADTQTITLASIAEAAEPRPPGGGSGGGSGGGIKPEPRPDCSRLENALSVANSQVAQSEGNERQLVNRIHEINSRILRIERLTDAEVQDEYNSLVNREDQSRREYERLTRELNNAESRLSQIKNNEIPNLENEQRNLSNERPALIARIDQAQSDVNKLSKELIQFKTRNDWDRKVAAVDSAQLQLQSHQAKLDSVLSQQRLEQQKLDQNIMLAQQAQDKINVLTSQLTALNNRAAELNEGLKNLPAERAPIDAKITSLQTELTNLKTKFIGLLN